MLNNINATFDGEIDLEEEVAIDSLITALGKKVPIHVP